MKSSTIWTSISSVTCGHSVRYYGIHLQCAGSVGPAKSICFRSGFWSGFAAGTDDVRTKEFSLEGCEIGFGFDEDRQFGVSIVPGIEGFCKFRPCLV